MAATATSSSSRLPFRVQALTLLGQHGLLTTHQLHTIAAQRWGHATNLGWCRVVLADAATAGLVDSVCLSHSKRKSWFLAPAGLEAIAGTVTTPMKMTAAIATGPTAAHLDLVNTLGIAVGDSLGPEGDVTWSHEEPLPLGAGRYLRPDAVLTVLTQQGGDLLGAEWFIEADRGTESIGTLSDKLVNYLTYRNYRPTVPGERDRAELHWKVRFRSWPRILFVFDCARVQTRIQRLAAWAGSDPRLQQHWGNLSISAISIEDLGELTADSALAIPTLERHSLLALA